MTQYTVMGPAGAPMRPPYGSFAGKPASGGKHGNFTVMGPAGAPMRPPYASFSNKPQPPTGKAIEWILRARRRHTR